MISRVGVALQRLDGDDHKLVGFLGKHPNDDHESRAREDVRSRRVGHVGLVVEPTPGQAAGFELGEQLVDELPTELRAHRAEPPVFKSCVTVRVQP